MIRNLERRPRRLLAKAGFYIATLDSVVKWASSPRLCIGMDGLGLISYYDGFPSYNLKVAHCDDGPCQPFVRRR